MPSRQADISEGEWQGLITSLARFEGWLVFHNPPKGPDTTSFPRLVLAKAPDLVVVLLKTERAPVTAAQQSWLDELTGCSVEVAVWRPSDWPKAERRLRGDRAG